MKGAPVNRRSFDVTLDMATFNSMKIGTYIQVPFCQTKCTYCNFHTGVVSRDRYTPYANAVRREIESWLASESDSLRNLPVDTVYFGGGTPSLLDSSALGNILDALGPRFAAASGL